MSDSNQTPPQVTETHQTSQTDSADHVALITDPYGLRNLEISEAQNSTEELILDEPTEEAEPAYEMPELEIQTDSGQLDQIAQALESAQMEHEASLQAQHVVDTEADAQLLATQIAEDQALQAEMAREAAEAQAALETDPELLAALPQEPVADETGAYDLAELESCLETLLFMLDKPTSASKLKCWLGPLWPESKEELFTQALQGLQARYSTPHHGIELVEISGGWQLRTKPGRAALAKKLAKVQNQRLSAGGMETLAIVAYRQPVMKEEIDKIRGVDSSYFIRGLMDRKLIAITGRSELVGRPMLYSTTETFLELFGLKDLAAMPPLRELESMVPASQSNNPDQEDADPRVREMRKLVGQMKSDTSTSLIYDPREDEKLLTEIRERVQAIPTSTAYLDEQKALEKQAKIDAKLAASGETAPAGTQLDLADSQRESEAPPILSESATDTP